MDPVPVLIITLAYITILAFSRKVPTFLFLFTGAVLMGLLAGFGLEQVLTWAIEGMGNIFSSFAVIILSGIVIVRLLSGFAGYNNLRIAIRHKRSRCERRNYWVHPLDPDYMLHHHLPDDRPGDEKTG
jgi:predicted histidine transporter YuiF (NhaC family)